MNMDAVKFLKEWERMCAANTSEDEFDPICLKSCPLIKLREGSGDSCKSVVCANISKAIEIVSEWSAAHPRKTRMDDFLEKYPNARISEHGIPFACARNLGYFDNNCCANCAKCWNTPLE